MREDGLIMGDIFVFSFNILTDCYGNEKSEYSFEKRSKLFNEHFLKYNPDLIGFQEAMPHQKKWLEDNLHDFQTVGCGRGKDYLDESCVIAYRKSRFDLITLDTFWLSPTPDVPGSRYLTDQSECPRICTSAMFLDKECGRLFRHYNTHLDHIGDEAKNKGMALILDRATSDYKKMPVPIIITGDFNSEPDSDVYKMTVGFKKCGEPLKDVSPEHGDTYHDFYPERKGKKIDFIFTNIACDRTRSIILHDNENSLYLSDHYPVGAHLIL